MATCVPIKDLKETASFAKTVEEADEPITVTRNGYDSFVAMSMDKYEAMQQEALKARVLARVMQAEKELASGQAVDGEEFIASLKEKYGL